jgi:polyhydroxyalkanoate synthase
MEKWIFDSPDQAGETFRQFMKDCYQKNLLIKNEMKLNDKKINLKNITMPVLNVMAEFDHLVPNDASIPLADAISSTDKDTLVFPTGHIGIFVGSKSQKEVCPKIAAWLKPRSDPNGKGEKKTGSVKEELPELAREKTGSVKEERSELAKEKTLEQNIKKRKLKVNKK